MRVKKCSLLKFRQQFSTTEDCLNYLSNEKWGLGYNCLKCKSIEYRKGNRHLDRRCLKCGNHESVTSNTLFHSIKLPLVIAFEMVYRIAVSKIGISSVALSREYDLNLKTTYHFKRKVQHSLKSSELHPLTGNIQVDEFSYGGKDEGCQGRSASSDKLKVCVAVEMVANNKGEMTMGRAYAQSIDNFSSSELEKIFSKHISKEAEILTDKWSGYSPLKQYYKIKQAYSNKGANFPNLHLFIMNMKSWIRGTHHKITLNHVQQYLDEFCFRFNRRTWMESMPIFALKNIMNHKPKQVILTRCAFREIV